MSNENNNNPSDSKEENVHDTEKKQPSWMDFAEKHGFLEELNEIFERLIPEIKRRIKER